MLKILIFWPRKGPKLKSIEVATVFGPFLDARKLAEAETFVRLEIF